LSFISLFSFYPFSSFLFFFSYVLFYSFNLFFLIDGKSNLLSFLNLNYSFNNFSIFFKQFLSVILNSFFFRLFSFFIILRFFLFSNYITTGYISGSSSFSLEKYNSEKVYRFFQYSFGTNVESIFLLNRYSAIRCQTYQKLPLFQTNFFSYYSSEFFSRFYSTLFNFKKLRKFLFFGVGWSKLFSFSSPYLKFFNNFSNLRGSSFSLLNDTFFNLRFYKTFISFLSSNKLTADKKALRNLLFFDRLLLTKPILFKLRSHFLHFSNLFSIFYSLKFLLFKFSYNFFFIQFRNLFKYTIRKLLKHLFLFFFGKYFLLLSFFFFLFLFFFLKKFNF